MMTDSIQIGKHTWKKIDLTIELARERETQAKKEIVRYKLPKAPPMPEKEAIYTWEMVKMMRLVASEWFSSGYKVNRLMRLLNDKRPELETMKHEFVRCEERIRELKRYEAGLRSLDTDDPDERNKIAAVISDLKDLDRLEQSAQNAEMLISEIQAKRATEQDKQEAMFRLTLASEWRERIRATKLEELYGTIISRLAKRGAPHDHMEFLSVSETSDAYYACTSKVQENDVIIIIGAPGSGKTRLLSETMNHAVSKGLKVLSWVMGTPPMEGDADVYLIDGLERVTRDTEEKLCAIIDSVTTKGKGRVIMACSVHIEDLKLTNDATLTRMSAARAIELPMLTFDSRVELLKKRAEHYGFKVRTGVLAYIARVRRGNTRSLLLAMDKLIAMSLLLKREIDIDFARETIPEH
jgi:chromosomal replication initiation ATPase DnaA